MPEVGQPEMDRLIHVYNRMVDSLRAERVRLQEKHNFLESSPGQPTRFIVQFH